MKKMIFRSVFLIFFLILLIISYLSIVGLETNRFNTQIINKIQSLDKNFEIDLKKIKILLDPFKFKINAKTFGPNLKYKNKIIEIENIKTQISLNSIINNEFSITNLEVSTKLIEIKSLISFARAFKNNPELYITEKLISKGYVIANGKFEFDANGRIKDNYHIDGIIKDTKIDLLKKYNIQNLNFKFNIENENFKFQEIKLQINNLPLLSDEILVNKVDKKFYINGSIGNKEIELDKKFINLFINPILPNLDINKVKLNSLNKFSFISNNRFKIDNFKLTSDIEINELKLINRLDLKNFLPKIKDEIVFNNNKLTIIYDNKRIKVKGNGKIKLQNNDDEINYLLIKEKDKYNLKTSLIINDNPIKIDLLSFKKSESTKLSLNFDVTHFLDKKTIINSVSIMEKKNKLSIKNILMDKKFKIESLENVSLNYKDYEKQKNELTLNKNGNKYDLNGVSFNANNLIEKLISSNDTKKVNVLKSDFNINLNIKKVYLDNEYNVQNLNGKLYIKNNELFNGNLNALFSKDKKMSFTVNSDSEGKVTTLFFDKAKPIVKKYKFIKGFEEGSLDFYSIQKEKKSKSTLKIYNFKLKELPALTKLLTLASLQGIADILSGEGIRFNEFEMNFENQDNLMTINEIYAIGPAISILMDGYVEKDQLISLRGTLVPATTINKAIGSIPLLGKILVGSKSGEGVFGVSFKIKGPPKNLQTTVNPIKTLTPRFITRTLEKIKKN